jgi:NTE family protein
MNVKSMPARPGTAPHRPPFDRIALVLQGGGALGSYQGGVYQALSEAGIHPDWVAGISIGAINSAIIAGNAPHERVAQLRRFWEEVSEPPLGVPNMPIRIDDMTHLWMNRIRAMGILMFGAPNFFRPRWPSPVMFPGGGLDRLSYYDISPVRELLGELVDFDRINADETRLSVGTVNVRTGNFLYFDNTNQDLHVDHILASGALPPGFPAIEIDGEYYWDGGVVSNTPLDWVLDSSERKDTLVFQVDLWNALGELPRDLIEADLRQKEIRFSSRTRLSTDHFRKAQTLRRAMADLLKRLPPDLRQLRETELLAAEADEASYSIIELIYHAPNYEGTSKDYEFSRRTMEEHWTAGYNDTLRTLRHPEVLEKPTSPDGIMTFDVSRQGRL